MQELKMEDEKMIQQELDSKIEFAQKHALIQNKTYTEIEFSIDNNGQATIIETWDTSERLLKDYRSIEIPEHLLEEFIFSKTLKYL